jgi:membrane-associated protein
MPVLFFNFNEMIQNLSSQHVVYFYLVLLSIVFIETGIVIFPFLPGDSLLFFAGSLAALKGSEVSVWFLIISLSVTAFVANLLNFEFGKRFGESLPKHPRLSKFIKPSHMVKAYDFFKKYGSFAIFLGRFMPVIRTIVPFVAGSGRMLYRKFLIHNLLGGISWVVLCVSAGYLFGNVFFVKEHFEIIMIVIILISLLPAAILWLKSWMKKRDLKMS